MFKHTFLRVKFFSLILFASVLWFSGCKDETTSPETYDTDAVALQALALEDSSNSSFEAAFNDSDPMNFLGKTATDVFPIRIGRRITSVSRTFSQTILSDTAYVTVNYNFAGNFFLVASYDSSAIGDTTKIDTVIVKPFTSVATRKLIFVRVNSTRNPRINWKLVAVSLPEGGTVTSNLQIQKLSIYLPSGDSIVVTSPNDYYLSKFAGVRKLIPVVTRGLQVRVKLDVFSTYAEDDIVVLTYGANSFGRFKEKRILTLVSSTPALNGYNKVYEQTFRPLQLGGLYHALVDVMSRGSIYTDNRPFENKVWGFPYYVK